MKMLILVVAATICSALLLFVLWRYQPGIPGLPRTPQARRLGAAWRLWLVFMLSGLVVSAIVALAVGEPRESSLGYLRFVLSSHNGDDSWMPMLRASAFLREHPDLPLYQSVFFGQHVKFQYPLTALLPLDLPQRLLGLEPDSVVLIFKILSRLSLVAIAVVFLKLFMGTVQGPAAVREPLQFPRVSTRTLLALSLLSVALFYPILRSEYHGQIQTAMTLAAGLALLAWQRGQPRMAGLMLALCCIIKPQWVIVILWALLRRQWRFAWTATWVTGAFGLLAIAVYGPRNVFDYVPVVSFLSRHGESYFINQSVNGLLHRLLFNGVNLQGAGLVWSGTDFPPFHPIVYVATTVSSALLLGSALLWKLGKRPSAVDLSLVMLSLTLASPIAWDHHYGVLLPIFAVLFPAAWRRQPWGVWTMPLMWIAFVLSSESFVGATNPLAGTTWNVLQSYQLFGALMVLGLLYRLSWQEQHSFAGLRARRGEALDTGLGRLA
ncbi:glycosyltransferase family 87 protein [Variovorax sp. MHTC-1]|uniref:glycosyltransferase family 87 protein n=1 Tax=Variovorax sp. MHTC-1 TaxID=2495593 RepID=UPI00163D15E9|nr:glycosyltransferase family 87 protein [Variovorax sp. MHTC-1]